MWMDPWLANWRHGQIEYSGSMTPEMYNYHFGQRDSGVFMDPEEVQRRGFTQSGLAG